MDSKKVFRALLELKLKQSDNRLSIGGNSMAPLIVGGDLISLERGDIKYKIGDILVVIDKENRLLVHRLIKFDGKMLVTKGDNAVATESVERSYCVGRAVLVSNTVGKNIDLRTRYMRFYGHFVAAMSRKVNKIYLETDNFRIATACIYHKLIYETSPVSSRRLSNYINNYIILLSFKIVEDICGDEYCGRRLKAGELPETPEKVNFTRDHLKRLGEGHLVMMYYPYVIPFAGRYAKFLKVYKVKRMQRTRNLLRCACAVGRAFQEAGIKYAIVKGVVASVFSYEDYIKREPTDVDFLIYEDDAQRAHEILYSMGFMNFDGREFLKIDEPREEYPTHYCPYLIPNKDAAVELHSAFHIDIEYTYEMLLRAVPIEIEGNKLYTLDTVDLFITQLVCIAADDHGCATTAFEDEPTMFLQVKIRNYIDIICAYYKHRDELPFKLLYERVIRYKCAFFVYNALYFTNEIFQDRHLKELLEVLNICPGYKYKLREPVIKCLFEPLRMKMNAEVIHEAANRFVIENHRRWYLSKHNRHMSKADRQIDIFNISGNRLRICIKFDKELLPPDDYAAVLFVMKAGQGGRYGNYYTVLNRAGKLSYGVYSKKGIAKTEVILSKVKFKSDMPRGMSRHAEYDLSVMVSKKKCGISKEHPTTCAELTFYKLSESGDFVPMGKMGLKPVNLLLTFG